MTHSTFSGFSPAGMELLIENRVNNSKDFYEAHKERIKNEVIKPFHALCETISDTMLEIDPLFVTNPTRMVSRVRRDTRYTKDKTLYRANMWIFFRRKKSEHEPVPFYYMEITPDFWGYGCFGGYGKGEMDIARQMILDENALFTKAYNCAQKSKIFKLDGELYKRDKFPDAKAEYKPWLNRKHLGLNFIENDDFSSLWDGSFVKPMLKAFTEIAPFYEWMLALHNNPERRRPVK